MTTIPSAFQLVAGTVIDHLPVGTASRALKLLGLPGEGPITVGMNVPSKRLGHKDIIRVEGLQLGKRELDRLALLGEQVTVSLVESGQVSSKIRLEVPTRLVGILACPNPTCVSTDSRVEDVFIREGSAPFRFRCPYCERVTPDATPHER